MVQERRVLRGREEAVSLGKNGSVKGSDAGRGSVISQAAKQAQQLFTWTALKSRATAASDSYPLTKTLS